MEVLLADEAGFCFGVKRAINTAYKAASEGAGVYCLGPIIHNPQEVERLRQAGVMTVDDLSSLQPGDKVIIRSHGVPPTVLAEACEKGLTVVDLTCPFVAKAQQYAKSLSSEGYQVVVVGEKDHPEVQSIVGHAGGNAAVVETPDDIAGMKFQHRIGVVAQTTQSYGNFSEIVLKLFRLSKELRVYNTICNSTAQRQHAARTLAAKADVMLVVGGRNSANTTRLAMVCRQEGKPTYHIETAEEIRPEWLEGVTRVGVTAGASTPDWIVDAVVLKLKGHEKQGCSR